MKACGKSSPLIPWTILTSNGRYSTNYVGMIAAVIMTIVPAIVI
jgi:hypothetical protein